ncbi:MAG TPA: hypothetical protein VFR28_03165 [Allosphingosinicella sp.]|jgi:hypothetical protein|nr:hypothetical protein [Allosphingosinicella sp.]
MKPLRAKLLFLAGGAALAFAIPAMGQREKGPESLLPPGFGEPPPPAPKAPPAETPSAPAPAPATPSPPPPPRPKPVAAPVPGLGIEDAAAEDLQELARQAMPPPIEIPDESRRPTNPVGPLRPGNWGLGLDAFGSANGRFLSGLMGRLNAPLPSRWTSILLRRALLSEASAPPQVNEVDWVAERAWLLLRMGEADSARMLVQAIDVDRFTPRMFTVAVQAALATSDPAALCPLVGPGRKVSDQPAWPLADAMCASLEGDAARASQLIDQARRRTGGGIDLLLAEKVIGAGTNTRRAVTIEWEGVDELNSWRFGLASATGLEIPEALLNRAGPAVWAWQARAPMIPLEQRVAAAQRAATLGVFSNASLVEMHSLLADRTDPSEMEGSIGGRLRKAYVAGSINDRLDAMRDLWGEGEDRYGRFILTAAAAARIPPSAEYGNRTDDLIASMMTAGFDRFAAPWGGVADGLDGDDGHRAWSILAVGAPRAVVDLSAGRIEDFTESAGGHRGRMLVAALAGLGRLEDPLPYGVSPAPRSRWANIIGAAARANQPGTVALLAGVGMQTASWRGVPPEHLYHIVKALKDVGLEYEARMIAAEAMTRL